MPERQEKVVSGPFSTAEHPTDTLLRLRARFEPLAKVGSAAWSMYDCDGFHSEDLSNTLTVEFARSLGEFAGDFDDAIKVVDAWIAKMVPVDLADLRARAARAAAGEAASKGGAS